MAIVTAHVAAVQQLYVAYFNRPADVAGLEYWTNRVEAGKGSTTEVSATFATSPEYQSLFTGLTNAQIVDKIYANLFGRGTSTVDGRSYWVDLLNKGTIKVNTIVAEVAKGALTTDAEAVENKVAGATAFTNALDTPAEQAGYKGDASLALAKAYITSITTDASLTVATAPATLAATVSKVVIAGTPFTLQSGLQALDAANAAKTAFLDAADGKVDKILVTEASIGLKVDAAVDAIDLLVPGYEAATSANVRAALLADKVAANAATLGAKQIEVAEDQVAISKVAGLSAAVAAEAAAKTATAAAQATQKTAAADLAAKLASYNSLNGTALTVAANGTVTGLIKLDTAGKLVLDSSAVTETANPGVTALLAASIANEAAEKTVAAATTAQEDATAQVNYLDIAATGAEVDALVAVKAAMVNVTVATGAMPTIQQIETEQAILDAKAAAAPGDAALQAAADAFEAKVATYTAAYGNNPLVTELTADQTAVKNASDAITALTKATTALTAANDLAAQLAAVNGSIAAATQAFLDNDLLPPFTLTAAPVIATGGSDIYVAGAANATVALFGLQGTDSLFIGSKYTLNTTATFNATTDVVTGGNDAVLEAFIVQDGADTKVILEKSVFGSSASTPEVVTITLTGVTATDVALSNGIITG